MSQIEQDQQGLLLEVDHSILGKINLPGPPLRFETRTPSPPITALPPTLGQHNETVRHWLDELEQPSRAGSTPSRVTA